MGGERRSPPEEERLRLPSRRNTVMAHLLYEWNGEYRVSVHRQDRPGVEYPIKQKILSPAYPTDATIILDWTFLDQRPRDEGGSAAAVSHGSCPALRSRCVEGEVAPSERSMLPNKASPPEVTYLHR